MAKTAHFIGIGGIGMSGFARYFKAGGWKVSGSDIVASDITRALTKEHIAVKIGHKASNLPVDAYLVIYNRAILPGNPELRAARARGALTLSYAEAIGKLTERYATIAITGSHGKSTTTALSALALMRGGLDPTVFIGTNLRELGGKNVRIGKSKYLVLEADDYGGALLHYSPSVAIVTNVDREHLDFYKTFGKLKKAFLGFLANVKEGGIFILNRDDAVLYGMRNAIVPIAKRRRARIVWYSLHEPAIKKVRRAISLPGTHNLSNASAVMMLGRSLKIPEKKTLGAIASYQGAWRRMEYKGIAVLGKLRVRVYDDYAHHPTEIKATLQAFREKYPRSPIICVYEPHQAKRLRLLFKEFTSAFEGADALVLLPLYRVAGRDPVLSGYDSAKLAATIRAKYPHKNIAYLAKPKNLKQSLLKILKKASGKDSPVVIMMGAGTIAGFTKTLLQNRE